MRLGMKLRDKLTGFEGVAISRTEWLYGCIRFGLQPTELKTDGSLQDAIHFDEAQLEEVIVVEECTEPDTGGPRDDPQRVKDPVR